MKANKSIHQTARAFFFEAGPASGSEFVEKAWLAYHLAAGDLRRY